MSMNNNPYQAYKQNAAQTASPGELTLMLYNGCLKFMKQAKLNIEEQDYEAKNTNIIKAQDIIRELLVTLNTDMDIAQQMSQLYEYMLDRLVQANIHNDVHILEEVEGYVLEFRDTWKEVIRINRQQQFGQGKQTG